MARLLNNAASVSLTFMETIASLHRFPQDFIEFLKQEPDSEFFWSLIIPALEARILSYNEKLPDGLHRIESTWLITALDHILILKRILRDTPKLQDPPTSRDSPTLQDASTSQDIPGAQVTAGSEHFLGNTPVPASASAAVSISKYTAPSDVDHVTLHSEDAAVPGSEDAAIPDSEDAAIPDSDDVTLSDSEDAAVPSSEDAAVPDSEDAAVLDSDNVTFSDSEDAAVLDSDNVTFSDSEDTAVPDSEDAAVPDAEDAAVPDAEDAAVPDAEDAAVPDSEDAAVPDAEDAAVPDAEDAAVPDAEDAAVPDSEDAAVPDADDSLVLAYQNVRLSISRDTAVPNSEITPVSETETALSNSEDVTFSAFEDSGISVSVFQDTAISNDIGVSKPALNHAPVPTQEPTAPGTTSATESSQTTDHFTSHENHSDSPLSSHLLDRQPNYTTLISVERLSMSFSIWSSFPNLFWEQSAEGLLLKGHTIKERFASFLQGGVKKKSELTVQKLQYRFASIVTYLAYMRITETERVFPARIQEFINTFDFLVPDISTYEETLACGQRWVDLCQQILSEKEDYNERAKNRMAFCQQVPEGYNVNLGPVFLPLDDNLFEIDNRSGRRKRNEHAGVLRSQNIMAWSQESGANLAANAIIDFLGEFFKTLDLRQIYIERQQKRPPPSDEGEDLSAKRMRIDSIITPNNFESEIDDWVSLFFDSEIEASDYISYYFTSEQTI
ncbi:hypothetical protein V8C35DRAFT_319042 [Trichoderma chlorosporum]